MVISGPIGGSYLWIKVNRPDKDALEILHFFVGTNDINNHVIFSFNFVKGVLKWFS